MQTPLQIKLVTESLPDGQLQISRLDGREAISQLFEYELHAACRADDDFDAEALMGEHAALVYERDEQEIARIFGMISVVHDRFESEGDTRSYRLSFVPRAYRLSLVETLDVFLDISVPDIIRQKLGAAGMRERQPRRKGDRAGDRPEEAVFDFELRLHETYAAREFVVQYKETDLAFIARLCEHIGISFFFEHESGRDVMVFTDVNEGFDPFAGRELPFRARGEHRDVYRFEETIRMIPAHYVVRDYNYRTPHVALTGAARVGDGTGSVVEYGTHVKTPEEAKHMAALRAQERLAGRRVFEGTCDAAALRPGSIFTLTGHARGDVGLLVTEVRPSASQVALGQGTSERGFQVEFKAIQKSRRFRPARVTPKPRIHGVVTGVIDAANKGEYAEIDEQGRYRVKFLFDTTDPQDAKGSRLVRMAQPHSGAGYGMHFPLRPGVEVIITFVDGDPDRPIIAATVPNPQTGSPVTSGNAPRNILRTGGGNEMNIDDTSGKHRIKLSTPHMGTTFQLGYHNAPEDGAILQTKGNQSTVALQSANTLTSLETAFTLFLKFSSALRIRTVAEFPMLVGPDGISIVDELAQVAVEIGQSVLEAHEAMKNKQANELQADAIHKQIVAKKKWEAVDNGENPSSSGYQETQAYKETLALAGLTAEDQKAFETQKQAYDAAQAKYKADLSLYRAREERLTEARKGERTGASMGQIAYWEAEVAKSKAALDGDPGATDAAARKGSKTVYDEAKAAYEAAIKAAQVTRAKSQGQTQAEAEKTADEKLEALHDANDLTAARTTFDEADATRQLYNDKVEANELDEDALALHRGMAAFKGIKAGMVLISDLCKLVSMALALYTEFESRMVRDQARMWLVGLAPPDVALGGLKALLATLTKWKPVKPIHTIGSAGKTRVYGEEELFMWSDKAILAGEESVLVTSKERLAFRTPGTAEVAGKENVYVNGGAVEMRASEHIAVGAGVHPDRPWTRQLPAIGDGQMLLEAQEKLHIESLEDEVLIKAAHAANGEVYIESNRTTFVKSTHKQVQIQAHESAFLESTDAGVYITANHKVGVESTSDSILMRAREDAYLASTQAEARVIAQQDVHLQSMSGDAVVQAQKRAIVNGGRSVGINGTQSVDISAPTINVGGALLVKGEPVMMRRNLGFATSQIGRALTKLDARVTELEPKVVNPVVEEF